MAGLDKILTSIKAESDEAVAKRIDEAKAQAMLAEDGEVDVQGIKDDIATLKAAAKLLGLAA